MHADDTSISFSLDLISNINKNVNSDLFLKPGWNLIGGRKKLNDIENSEAQNLEIVVDQEPVSMIKHTKYLGNEVDQLLNWEAHISTRIKKISKGIGVLRYGKRYLPLTTVQSMYRSIIEPHVRFCCSVGSLQCYHFK